MLYQRRLYSYGQVWDCSIRLYKDMVTAEDWRNPSRAVFDEPIIQRLTFKFALLIIGICGFGLTSLSWNDPLKASADMSTQESLKVVSETMVAAALAPKWFWKLPIG